MTDNVGNMAREKRRERILAAIGSTDEPQSAGALGDRFGVSRQVIVQDIAVLRAEGAPIVSSEAGKRMLVMTELKNAPPPRPFSFSPNVTFLMVPVDSALLTFVGAKNAEE